MKLLQKRRKRWAAAFLVVLVIALLRSGAGWSQTELGVAGLVVDDSTGAPVPAANVLLLGTLYGVTTDERGHFAIRGVPPGQYQLQVRHIAYVSRVVPVVVGTEITELVHVSLIPRVLLGGVVQVTASAPRQGMGVTVLSRRDIVRSGASTLGELLRAMPGVEVQPSATGTTIVLRGGSNDQILVVLDGVPLNDPVLGTADVANLPVSWLESVKITRGSASARYGSGALAGVIELRTRRHLDSGASVEAAGGSYGYRSFAPGLEFRTGRMEASVMVSTLAWKGDYTYDYSLGSGRKEDVRRNSDFRTAMAGLSWEGRLSRDWLAKGTLHFERSERGIPGSIYALSPFARSRRNRWIFSGSMQHEGAGHNLLFRVAARQTKTQFTNILPEDAPVRYRSVPAYDTRGILRDVRLHIEWSRHLARGRIALGLEGNRLVYRDRSVLQTESGPVGQARTRAGALWGEWRTVVRIGRDWLAAVSTRLRADVAQTTGKAFLRVDRPISPGFAVEVSRARGNGLRLVASLNHAFRLPTYGDLFYREYRVRGNPDLRPEKSWEGSFGAGGQHRCGRLRLNWQAVRYQRNVRDQIIWRLGNFGSFSPTNVDARVSGTELSVGLATTDASWRLEGSADWLRTVNLLGDPTVHGKALPFRPDHRWKLVLEHRFGSFSVLWTHSATGRRWVTEANTVRLPGFQLDDVVLRWKFAWWGLRYTLSVAVFNALDRQYEVLENAPQPGREWRLSLAVRDDRTRQ